MTRPTFQQIYMQFAKILSKRSTCKRLSVGTVITSMDYRKVLSLGYNGNASGLYHNDCDKEAVGYCGCLHSEENAVINCDVPRDTKKIVFITHFPCKMCVKRLINLGNVQQIYYCEQYRLTDSLSLLEEAGINITQMGN
jgi:dCMP deaminase